MVDDDVARERARLEALAWGPATPPDEAARARVALAALVPSDDGRAGSVHPDSAPSADGPGPGPGPSSGTPAAVSSTHLPGTDAAGAEPVDHDHDHDHDHDVMGSARARSDGPPGVRGPGEPTRVVDAPADGGDGRGGGGSGLPSDRDGGRRDLVTRVREAVRTTRPRIWIVLGAAVTAVVAFGAGTVVGTAHEQTVSAPQTTPTPGAVTLEELLDIPQTYADQLPGPVEAPVSLRTTRLVFTNRALDGSAFETPWNVWAGVGTDRSTICLVATANRLASTTACYPREDALHGSVSLSAQSTSGTLTVTLRGGAVQGTVTNES
ncbi:hypothetical protein [Curtobacterium sp. MCBA15_004]|uniref:hypothetical protein n=1 Tax=Curtobacterium sp. MCBA15_004 TaxID=1898733 RepID=UPI0008DD0A87|nr:hypothetical protein [Curtobacterium sp. MCBA15_004]WIA98411.1 hypothetical protein QOL16_08510 [Curtobacterium sp. MCBA15_004]